MPRSLSSYHEEHIFVAYFNRLQFRYYNADDATYRRNQPPPVALIGRDNEKATQPYIMVKIFSRRLKRRRHILLHSAISRHFGSKISLSVRNINASEA